jgi:O6-methylguanine-DNA--protein-cysteine methyltransferase
VAVPKGWPEQWNGGARSTVEPFLTSFFGIELTETWCYLVNHNELGELPAPSYNPLPDADAHANRHVSRACKNCSVWRMLSVLWNTTARLYDGRMRLAIWNETHRLLKRLRARAAALERDGPSDVWIQKYRESTHALEELSSVTLDAFDTDTRAVLTSGRRDHLLGRICRMLHGAGFSYAEVARLIGERAPNAADRVRKRCKSAKK